MNLLLDKKWRELSERLLRDERCGFNSIMLANIQWALGVVESIQNPGNRSEAWVLIARMARARRMHDLFLRSLREATESAERMEHEPWRSTHLLRVAEFEAKAGYPEAIETIEKLKDPASLAAGWLFLAETRLESEEVLSLICVVKDKLRVVEATPYSRKLGRRLAELENQAFHRHRKITGIIPNMAAWSGFMRSVEQEPITPRA